MVVGALFRFYHAWNLENSILQEVTDMTTLNAKKRNPEIKAKRLRREGFATGVLYGREIKDSIPLQFTEKDASRFMKDNKEGAKVTLSFDGKEISALVKNIDYDSMKNQLLALDFQALIAGEMVFTTVPVKLLNMDSVQGVVEQELNEIHYKAAPIDLLDPIEIDFTKLPQQQRNLRVGDLKLVQQKHISLITPEDALIFHIGERISAADDDSETVAEDAAATPTI